jgi:hypothetical protein
MHMGQLPRLMARMRSAMLRSTGVGLFAVLATTLPSTPAQAAKCPPASVGGPSIGKVTVGGASVPIKPVQYPRGGTLRPPETNQAAGLSVRHAPLTANEGTTVIVWHVRYEPGCRGTLNPLLDLPVGATFTVTPRGTQRIVYRITDRVEVRKGRYQAEWFSLSGPRRLSLFTCGDLRGGEFRSTIATFAEPVTEVVSDVPASSPSP